MGNEGLLDKYKPKAAPDNPVVFLEISMGGLSLGTLYLELFAHKYPKTAENFLKFSCGDFEIKGIPVGYKGSGFHRVIKDFMIQGGDFLEGNGTGYVSIYGTTFDDENLEGRHVGAGCLSMANNGPNQNGCQFFITSRTAEWLDGKHVLFGKLLNNESLQVLRTIENAKVDSDCKPVKDIIVTECGQM